MATESDIYTHYEQVFKNIYADLVAVTGDKPREILFEMEACFAHLAVAKTSQDAKCQASNIDKAYNHLIRASLDAVKLLWLSLRRDASKFFSNDDVLNFGGNISKIGLMSIYRKAEQAAITARRHEVNNVGKTPEDSVNEWYAAVEALQEFLSAIDPDKVSALRRFMLKAKFKEYAIGFVLGVLGSTVVSWCWPSNPMTEKQVDPVGQHKSETAK